jgi:raffinose/stachyose/melibiose transport system substrate-binding protein
MRSFFKFGNRCSLTVLVLIVLSVSSVWATGSSDKNGAVNLEIATNASDPVFGTLNSFFNEYMAQNPNVKIDFSSQEGDYEQLMKARMAAGDLPDMFATHGWSVVRYSEYLRPLNDQPWFSTVQESFLPIIQNEKKEIFVMPFDMDRGCLLYNKALLAELGAEPPKTWAEFMDICKKGKARGYTGVFIAGKDNRQPANLLDMAATTFYISRTGKNYTSQLLDGTFDWNEWASLSQFLRDLSADGYLNEDAGTCDPLDIPVRLAENTTLFVIVSNLNLVRQVQEINPKVEMRMAPLPAFDGNDQPAFSGGERQTFGVWKNTKYEKECLAILSYLARPEIVKRLCESSGNLPAIKGVTPNFPAILTEDYAAYARVPIYPIFDRVYLPNGMWSTLRTTGSAIVAGEMSVQESINAMREDYKTLRDQAGL